MHKEKNRIIGERASGPVGYLREALRGKLPEMVRDRNPVKEKARGKISGREEQSR